jgi:hypothetical protein
MSQKRNSPLIDEAEPKAEDFAKRYRVGERTRELMRKAFLAGYVTGALREERRAPRRIFFS